MHFCTTRQGLHFNTNIYCKSVSVNIHYNLKATWKCFVRPGVEETGVFFTSNKVFIVELLPTFG